MDTLTLLIIALCLYLYMNPTILTENFTGVLKSTSRGLVTMDRSGLTSDDVASFTEYQSQCIGGEGQRKWIANSSANDAQIILNTNDPIHGKPQSTEMINGRLAPVWIVNDPLCPIDGVDGAWGAWSPCSAKCGTGTQMSTLSCAREPKNGGKPCSHLSRKQPCNTQPCPVDGVDGAPGAWGPCSATCGGGTQSRTLTCAVSPKYGGKPCSYAVQKQACNTQACPPAEPGPVVTVGGNNGTVSCTRFCNGTWGQSALASKYPQYKGAYSMQGTISPDFTCPCTLSNKVTWNQNSAANLTRQQLGIA
jgi:hypothetical protein